METCNLKVTSHTTYKFRRFLSVENMCMLYSLGYSPTTTVLTLIMDGNRLEQFIFHEGKVFHGGETPKQLKMYFSVNGLLFEFPSENILITFQLNSQIRFVANDLMHIVHHATCRFYN